MFLDYCPLAWCGRDRLLEARKRIVSTNGMRSIKRNLRRTGSAETWGRPEDDQAPEAARVTHPQPP